MTGLVIVLAPVWVRDRARWRDDLTILVGSPYLTKARFIVVEVDEAAATPVVEKLGPAGSSVDARIDDGTLRAEMSARLDAMKAAPPGATALQLLGAAGPAGAPPPRQGSLPPLSPAPRPGGARAARLDPPL